MSSTTVRLLHTLLLVLAAGAGYGATPPADGFFGNPAIGAALLSPNARNLALRVAGDHGHDALAVLDLETNGMKVVADFTNIDIDEFEWVNSERLVFDMLDKRLGVGVQSDAPGLYAVNRDGSALRQLATHIDVSGDTVSVMGDSGSKWTREPLPSNTYLLNQSGPQDANTVYVTSPKYNRKYELDAVDLIRLDTVSGRFTTIARPPFTRRWLIDRKGEPRIAIAREANMEVVHYRDPASGGQWRKLAEFDTDKGGHGSFLPVGFSPDGKLYIKSNLGTDKLALHSYDIATRQISKEPLVTLKDFDFTGELIVNKDKLLGVSFVADAKSVAWFDPGMKAVQEAVDAILPSTVNLVSVGSRAEAPWVLVEAYSDVQPPIFLTYNTQTRKMTKIGASYPKIVPGQMGKQELVRYKARDGLDIPAWLTLPNGSARKDLPLVVLAHRGPFVRGKSWGWDGDAQFLASRGYAVLQPEFRGSTGFGMAHFKAGWKQWGLGMQNDLADGARWAIAQGIVDPRRICIAGSGYGGYATMMGLVNDPDLYKCGVSWLGISDISMTFSQKWNFDSTLGRPWKEYGIRRLVGDPIEDAAQFRATSPLQQATRIGQPLLLAYGGADLIVPLAHGRQIYELVKANNPHVEWLVYRDEGHGWAQPNNRVDFWSRVETFLERHIGKR